jgi:hypothetical protein
MLLLEDSSQFETYFVVRPGKFDAFHRLQPLPNQVTMRMH